MTSNTQQNEFVKNFMEACVTFLIMGDTLRGKERDATEVLKQLIENISGKQDIDTVDFGEIMVPLYNAVCTYGIKSIEVDYQRSKK